MNKIIIGVSGKKQSGKDTTCELLKGFFSSQSSKPYMAKIYSFADVLKQKICIDVMGLTKEQCYGTDEQKNSLTMYKWENMPDSIRNKNSIETEEVPFHHDGTIENIDVPVNRSGFMTAREILQIVGTDIFREYFDDSIWVNATLKAIKNDRADVALISDVRFPSEIKSLIDNNGIIIRLLRNIKNEDTHESETALDNYDWNLLGNSVYIIDNRKMSIKEQNEEVIKIVIELIGSST